VKRTISRQEGDMVFNAGEWRAKLSDGQQFRGYYSALLVREGERIENLRRNHQRGGAVN
jgi:hypothetical protein